MPFSSNTLDFLIQNRLNNSRTWFKENRSDYEEYVIAPMKELTERLLTVIADIDEQAGLMRISRVNRDTRFIKDGFLYRENMWCTFGRSRELYQALPAFYCDISPEGFEYGCGYYCASTATMNGMRKMILENNPLFEAAASSLRESCFSLYGDLYKRDHYPDQPREKSDWLNRKTIGVTSLCHDWDLIFSASLADKIGSDFKAIASIYEFFMRIEESNSEK